MHELREYAFPKSRALDALGRWWAAQSIGMPGGFSQVFFPKPLITLAIVSQISFIICLKA